MNEEEARTKWCPMARVSTYEEGNSAESAANRIDDGRPHVGSGCIGYECMMFRKDPKYSDSYYCGLGGKP